MSITRLSASSYSNTAPLIWSFLYGSELGKFEMILDNAPARSAELLANDRVDAALVPVIAYQLMDNIRLVPDVCVGAKNRVRSVCLLTRGKDLSEVRSVALDVSSRTSAVLTRLLFKEFIGTEPAWKEASPNVAEMLASSDAALVIGDPALRASNLDADDEGNEVRVFDLAELWNEYTGYGFVFAMWMTRQNVLPIDFARSRDDGIAHIDEIAANYSHSTGIGQKEMVQYLSSNISYRIDESMRAGMEMYFRLAAAHGLIPAVRPLQFI
jgi:chorismate dehydratase